MIRDILPGPLGTRFPGAGGDNPAVGYHALGNVLVDDESGWM